MKRNKLFHSAVMETTPALESIDFQPTAFPDAIRDKLIPIMAIAKSARDVISLMHDAEDYIKDIEKVIKSHTGLTIGIHIDPAFYPSASIFYTANNNNNVLFTEEEQAILNSGDRSFLLNAIEKNAEKNTVDIAKGTVTGIYAKLYSRLTMTFGLLKHPQMTPEMVTAVLLHEIGHIFVIYEYTNRQVRTNQVMAAVVSANREQRAVKEFETVLISASKLLGGNGTEFRNVVGGVDNDTAIATVVIDAGQKITKSALGISEYDYTGYEMLADQYVSRYRYGRHLLDANDALPKEIGVDPAFGEYQLMAMGVAPVIASAAILTAAIGMTFSFLPAAVSLFVALCFAVNSTSDEKQDYTYDELKTRFKRIREQNIALLKTRKAGKDTEDIISNLKAMDKVIEKTHIPPNYLRSIVRYFSKTNKGIADSVQFQRDMEELAHNDLFVKAKELQTL